VADFKGPDGNKIERTIEVLDGNQQLRETIHFTTGRSQREVYLRYVYDLKSGDRSTTKWIFSAHFPAKNSIFPRPGRVDGIPHR
jgi:hypothetical protein